MTRREAVQSLVQFDRPLDKLAAGVHSFPWDWDGAPLATVRREHVLHVLNRWQAGQLTAEQVEDWANLIECRDDVDYDPADLADAIFDLANPVLEGPLDELGPAWLEKLKPATHA